MEYQVKGSTLKTKVNFVEERFGAEAKERLLELVKQQASIYPLLTGAWYPFSLFVNLLTAIAENHFGGELSRLEELGVYSAQKVLGSIYKAFVREGDFLGFLHDHSRLHHMFYNLGSTKVVVHDDSMGADIVHEDKPSVSEADLYVGLGFYREAARMHGLDSVECSFANGRDTAQFIIRWA